MSIFRRGPQAQLPDKKGGAAEVGFRCGGGRLDAVENIPASVISRNAGGALSYSQKMSAIPAVLL